MKCLILGFEVTSENSYWEHVVAHPQIEKVFIVDVASKKMKLHSLSLTTIQSAKRFISMIVVMVY